MERLSSGIRELDLILGGGLPTGSLLVIAGAPGTGKTILAQTIAFANATAQKKSVYYTTLSEPHTKILRHLESFDFFDVTALGTRVEFVNLTGGEPGGLEALTEEIVRRAFEVEPAVVVIDSARTLQEGHPDRFRKTVYDLASRVSHTNAILIFVGEYETGEIAAAPEFAVADGIIHLTNEPRGTIDTRTLRIVKMRGSDYLSGTHSFRIGRRGVEVYPRFESVRAVRRERESGRAPFGVPGLDEMLGGGIPTTSSTLIGGPSGVGKTVAAVSFIAHGLEIGRRSLYVSLQGTAPQLIEKAEGFGVDLQAGIDAGMLKVLHFEPIELGLDAAGKTLRAEIETFQPDRAVVDSIAELRHAIHDEYRYTDFLWALVDLFRSGGSTTLYTSETAAFFGPAFELAGGNSYVFDNILLLRYTELESEIRRALAIVKMRDSDHEKSLVEFEIAPEGFIVGEKFLGLSGVLTGMPTRIERRFREFFER